MKGFLATLKGKVIIGTVAGVCVLAAGVVVYLIITAPKDYRSIKVNNLFGTTLITDVSNVSENAYEGMNLESGDNVFVETDSNMTLLFDADKYMFADAGTKFKVVASGNGEKSTTRTKIILEEGSVLCRLDTKLKEGEVYEIETPNSTMSVRGTIFRMSIYKDESGENYTQLDVLEGAVKVDLHYEDGEKTGEEGIVEAGFASTVHSNPEISEFVIGESTISYEDFTEPMAQFVIDTVDSGREICIEKELFAHYTGLENHPEIETVIKEATCKEEGKKEIYCSTCDRIVRVETIEKLEHTPGEWEDKDPAICNKKATEVLKCTECLEEIEVREIEDSEYANHKLGAYEVTKKVTCTENGEETSTCEVCGETKTRVIEATGHKFGEWEETTKANCTVPGEKTRICNECGEKETENLSVTAHAYGLWAVTTKATCTTDGKETRTCSECGNTQVQTIAALGHTYGAWVANIPATCTTDGEETRTCSVCGNKETKTVAALGHKMEENWQIMQNASCNSDGEKIRFCVTCGNYSETERIAGGTGHNFPAHTSSANHSWVPLASDPNGQQLDYVVAQVACSTCKDYGDDMQEYYEYQVQPTDVQYDEATGQLKSYTCTCGYTYN